MRALKSLSVFLLVLVLAALAGAAAIYAHLNSIVKKGIETFGPLVTHTTVRLKSAGISPFSGRGRLRGFVIGNADGFPADTSLGLRDVLIFVDPRSFTEPKIVVHDIIIDSPIIIYETGPQGDNLQQLRRSIESFLPPADVDRRVEIGLFLVKNAKVHVKLKVGGGAERPVVLPLPAVVLTDIGKGKGAEPKEAVSKMLGALIEAVQKAVVEAKRQKGKDTVAQAEAEEKPKDEGGGVLRGVFESALNAVAPWIPLVKSVRKMIER